MMGGVNAGGYYSFIGNAALLARVCGVSKVCFRFDDHNFVFFFFSSPLRKVLSNLLRCEWPRLR